MKRMPPTAESIEILTAEKESLEDRLAAAEKQNAFLRGRLNKLSTLLTSVPGLPVEAYTLLR
jgi:hypothetical protein